MNTPPKKRALDSKSQNFEKDREEKEKNRKKLRMIKAKSESEFNKAINGEEAFDPHDFDAEGDDFAFAPFNLNQEREEGYFDKSGNYHEQTEDDPWLESLNEAPTPAPTPQPQLLNDGDGNAKNEQTDDFLNEQTPESPISLQKLIKVRKIIYDLMLNGEKVSGCLSRVGRNEDKTGLNALMDALDVVAIQHGELEVYDYDREKMLKTIIEAEEGKNGLRRAKGEEKSICAKKARKSTFFREKDVDVKDEVWEFEWVGKEGKVEGPTSLIQLKEWNDKKCFDVPKIVFWNTKKKNNRTHSDDLCEVLAVYGL